MKPILPTTSFEELIFVLLLFLMILSLLLVFALSGGAL